MAKCAWQNVHGKMCMAKCAWQNVHGKMLSKIFFQGKKSIDKNISSMFQYNRHLHMEQKDLQVQPEVEHVVGSKEGVFAQQS